MRVLIVHSNPELSRIWGRHLLRLGLSVTVVSNGVQALAQLQEEAFEVIVLDLVLDEGSALAIADFARLDMRRANVVFVTATTFFSDGSIFRHSANARAFINTATPPADLAEIVHHYCEDQESLAPPKTAQPANTARKLI